MGNDQSSNRGASNAGDPDGDCCYAQGDGALVGTWDRGIKGEGKTVQREVEYALKRYPDKQIYVGSGIHGSRDQYKNDDDMNSFAPEARYVDKRFYENDRRNVGDHSRVHVLDLGHTPGQREMREAFKDDGNVAYIANCHGKDNKHNKKAESTSSSGSVRGVCPSCAGNVYSTQERVKVSGRYYHESCY